MSRTAAFAAGTNKVAGFKNVRGEHTGGSEGTRALVAHDHEGNELGWVRYDKSQRLVENIEVHPEHRRTGVGTALLQELNRRQRVGGPRSSWTSTPRTDDGAALLSGIGRQVPVHEDWSR